MRILLISRSFPPEITTVAILYGQMAAGLAKRGHEVTVVTRSAQTYLADETPAFPLSPSDSVNAPGVRVRHVPTLPVPGQVPLLRAVEQVCTAFSFFPTAALSGPQDVALIYSPPLPFTLSAWAIRAVRGIPFVLNVQDLYPQTAIDLGLLRNPVLVRLAKALERFAYRNAAHIVVHGEGNRDHMIAHGVPREGVSVIPNWVDTESIAPGPRDNWFREKHGLTSRFVVSYAGVMGFAQGLEVVIEAADLLRDEKDVVFVLVGEGVRKASLEADAARRRLPNVRFLPLQPPELYPDVLSASDACLVTLNPKLRTPVVPGKLQAIMAAGRPAIASLHADGDAPRIMEEVGCGIATDPADASTLASAILTLSRNPELRDRMGGNGREYALKHYSVDTAVDRYAKVLEAAARPAPSGRRGTPE